VFWFLSIVSSIKFLGRHSSSIFRKFISGRFKSIFIDWWVVSDGNWGSWFIWNLTWRRHVVAHYKRSGVMLFLGVFVNRGLPLDSHLL
jgi:hypothetical protein